MDINILMALFAGLSFSFNIYQYHQSKAKLKVGLGSQVVVNEDGDGTFLAGRITVSNIGNKPTYFSNVKIIQPDGDYYYPLCSLEGGTKIEPGQSIVGDIPVGHLKKSDVAGLIVCDGVWKEYKMSRKKLLHAINELVSEKNRLDAIGF